MATAKATKVADQEDRLNRVFSALADPTRRAALARLTRGPASVGELAEPHEMSAAAFSKHLKVLREAGLITKELDGRRHLCSLAPSGLQAAIQWVATYERFWSDGLDGLEAFLRKAKKAKKKTKR